MSTASTIQRQSIKKQISLIKTLVRWRMQYYVFATADALKRNSQIAILLILALGPMLMGLLAAMGKPLFVLLNGSNITDTLMLWGGFIAVSLVWVVLQKNALMGGLANQYMQSLPVPIKQRLIVDFLVLLSTNAILFIPYAIAILYSLTESISNMFLNIVLILLWMLTVVLLQLQLLHRISLFWISILCSILSPIAICLTGSKALGIVLALFCIALLYVMLHKNKKAKSYHLHYTPFWLHLKSNKSPFQNLMRIYIRQLLQNENRSQQIMLLFVMLLPLYVLPQVHVHNMLQNLFWLRWKEQGLFLFISSVWIGLIVILVASWQMQLKTRFKQQMNFLNCHGVVLNTIYRTQDTALMIMGSVALVPIMIMMMSYLGLANGLLLVICVLMMLMLNIRLYRFPENMHIVVKLIIFVGSVFFIRVILGYMA